MWKKKKEDASFISWEVHHSVYSLNMGETDSDTNHVTRPLRIPNGVQRRYVWNNLVDPIQKKHRIQNLIKSTNQ